MPATLNQRAFKRMSAQTVTHGVLSACCRCVVNAIRSFHLKMQGALHVAVVDAIRPFLPQLRSTPNGKRILSKINVKI